MTPDQKVTRCVKEAFVRDQRISGQRIEVSAQDGIVALRGSVQSYRRKLAAEEIAVSVHDCHGVVNELAVTPAQPLPDEGVGNLVRTLLDAHADSGWPTPLQ